MHITTERPNYVGPSWLRHTTGFAFASLPPKDLMWDHYLSSPNLWERVVCITLQAQRGDFRNVGLLIDTICLTTDPYLGVAAVKVFAHAAPLSILPRLTSVFDHRDYDTRVESYTAPALACDINLTEPLLKILPARKGDEREYVAGTLWDMLEADRGDDAYLINLDSQYESLLPVALQMIAQIVERFGPRTAILHGAPLSLGKLIEDIRRLCERDDHIDMGGEIDQLMSIFEAMTGVSRIACFTSDCAPELPAIASVLATFEKSGQIANFKPGRRYFFGHPIPFA